MKRLAPRSDDRCFIRRLAIVAIALAFCLFVYRIGDIVLLAFGASLVAILLATVADWLAARSKMPRALALAIASLLMLAIFGLMGWLFGAETGAQATQLWQTLPNDWEKLRQAMESNPIGRLFADSFRQGSQGSRFAHLLLSAGWSSVEVAANFLIIVIGGIFFAAQPDIYRRGILHLTPHGYRAVAADAMDDLVEALRLWLLTQLVSMTMMGVMIGLGLWWSGVQAPAALGLLGGLSEFTPYVGPTLAMLPAIIMALVGKGSIWGVVGTYVIVRIVQVHFITPLISQRLVSVPAGLYLFLILAMGVAFGGFGIFFAGALSVAAYTLTIRLYVRETIGDDVALPDDE
ncbi:AI-2E family transporter [Sphingomonas sp. CGMCC 1.13654]|uniref:AI-2E family transporter n=1 Tax=Sphingomonas chungangi TaxID=2683589 RepID=A0A838L7I9_9SPHN|nr:AI-2E family transporter [Sphingomonas chungangi]MBA2934479.1 AI-2E family transporter [Sphingomonas chungangi]